MLCPQSTASARRAEMGKHTSNCAIHAEGSDLNPALPKASHLTHAAIFLGEYDNHLLDKQGVGGCRESWVSERMVL